MGKSSSKLSAEAGSGSNYSLDEKDLKYLPDSRLTDILEDEKLLAPFLTDIFFREVEVSDCMQTLFRGNCLASKVMSQCFRTFGSEYLKELLEPHIKPLILLDEFKCAKESSSISSDNAQNVDVTANIENTTKPNSSQISDNCNNNTTSMTTVSYEIDPTRLEEDDRISENQRNLLKLTKQILNSILSSSSNFPPQLNLMCICLRRVLCERYLNTNTNLKAVGTVIFLRFINPAIVSPYEAGIVDKQPSPRVMRGLMLVSKILQNIANNVEFSKEEHMLPFNDFVRAHFEPVLQWVLEISTERPQTRNFVSGTVSS